MDLTMIMDDSPHQAWEQLLRRERPQLEQCGDKLAAAAEARLALTGQPFFRVVRGVVTPVKNACSAPGEVETEPSICMACDVS